MEAIRNISVQKVKNRPNSYIYKLSLPAFTINTLGVKEEDKKVKIYEEDNKIIIEKI